MDDAQAAAAEAEHRVLLVERVHHAANMRWIASELLSQRLEFGVIMGQELVQWRVEQPDGDRMALHRAEYRLEVTPLHRQQAGKRALTLLLRRRKDHLAHCHQPLAVEEHVLGTAQSDALGAEVAAAMGIRRSVG